MLTLADIAAGMEAFAAQSPLNRVPEIGLSRIFSTPLVGIAAADDPLFFQLKRREAVGPQHLSPGEWLEGAQAVVSYFLPFSSPVREAERMAGPPAREWLYGRVEGEAFNDAMRRTLTGLLTKAGSRALAPVLDARFAVSAWRSNWSERHIAFLAGLGTFSLNRSLITAQGCAGRFGSVITSAALEPSPRRYRDLYDYCTLCLRCAERCPAGAISEKGKNIDVCARYLNEIKEKYAPRYGCGKCQTAVPCESGIPGEC